MSLLKITNLQASYSKTATPIRIENLNLNAGEISFLLGPNGAGKSSLLKTIAKLLPISSGSLSYAPSADAKESLPVYLSPNNSTQEGLTGWDLAEIIGSGKLLLSTLAEQLNVNSILATPLHILSSGEVQRLRLAVTLAIPTDLYLLDEPLSFLEIQYKFVVAEIIQKLLLQKKSFLIASHDLEWSLQFVDATAIALSKGQALAQGPVTHVLTHPKVQEAFGFLSEISSNPINGDKLLALAPYGRTQK